MGSERHALATEQQFARLLLEAQERLQGVRPARAARWRQSPRISATPSLDAQLKPRWGGCRRFSAVHTFSLASASSGENCSSGNFQMYPEGDGIVQRRLI